MNDLLDEPAQQSKSSNLSTAIDKEAKGLAFRIKKCPHYKSYKNYYFWEEIGGYLWNEDNLETLIKVLARRELADLLPQVFSSRTTHAIFTAMSYSYRITFIEHLLSTKEELLAELSSNSRKKR